MANELYFFFEDDQKLAAAKDFLLSRPNYNADGNFLSYVNEDTDFVFTAECIEAKSDTPEYLPIDTPCINFRINYLRPDTYVEEVSLELAAFVRAFPKARFFDETTDSEEDFSLERFKTEWRKANEGGLSGQTKEYNIEVFDDDSLHRVWVWNFGKRSAEIALKEEVYFGKVMFLKPKDNGNLHLVCTWPDLIPIAIPSFVDDIVFIRPPEEPSGLVAKLFRKKNDEPTAQIVPFRVVLATDAFEKKSVNGIECYMLSDASNSKLQAFLSSSITPMSELGLKMISADSVVGKKLAN